MIREDEVCDASCVFARTRGHGDPDKVLNGNQPSPKDAAFDRNIDSDVNGLSKSSVRILWRHFGRGDFEVQEDSC